MDMQKAKLYINFYYTFAKFLARQHIQRLSSVIHRHTYRSSLNSRNVVVVGGSFAGSHLAQRLAHTLPTGHRVVLVERNSHMHYTFAFPRNAVFSGRETRALIPYDNLSAGAPDGVFQHIQDAALSVTESHVNLAGGCQLKYDYLVLATGATQPPPTRLQSSTWDKAVAELQIFQQRIKKAERIAVVGGGAAGIELVTEMRAKYPDKKLSLVHSKTQLLPRFGPKLHAFVLDALHEMEIDVVFGERPVLPAQAGRITDETQMILSTGETRVWDMMIPCTGSRPNSDLLASYTPRSIAPNGEILVKSTLQVDALPSLKGNIFAFGDVAKTGGPKQGRAGMMQGEVVLNNILRLIGNQRILKDYSPLPFEGAIQLTMGTKGEVMYIQNGAYELLEIMKKKPDDDLGAAEMWKRFHADLPQVKHIPQSFNP